MRDELPEGWAIAPIGEIADINPRHPRDLDESMLISFAPMAALNEEKPVFQFLDERPLGLVRKGFTHFGEGDVLFAKITPCMENGKGAVAIGLSNGLGCGTTELHVIRPFAEINPYYIYRFLAQPWVRRAAKDNFTGTAGQARVPKKFIEELEIPLPPLAEQQRIVAKLEKLLGKVDACQNRLAKIPALLKRFRQSVLSAACSGNLTADWREANPNANSVKEIFPVSEDSPALPETWAWCPLGQYVDNFDKTRIPVSSKKRAKRKGSYPYYGASGIIDSIDGFTHEGEFILIGEDGANLLARSKPIAFLASGKIWVNNHAHVLQCKHGFPNSYLCYYINSIDLSFYVTGTAQPKLNQANMNKIPIPVAPLDEQQEIDRRVKSFITLAEQIETRYATAQGYLDNLTPSLLSKAFRGELVRTEAEIAQAEGREYEPATVLLRRIKSKSAMKQAKSSR